MKKLIFLLGAEGCGHHALLALLDTFISRSDVDFQSGEWHAKLIAEWSTSAPKQGMLENLLRKKVNETRSVFEVQEVYESIAREMAGLEDTGIFLETCSFPYDLPRKIDRSPDMEMFDLVFQRHFDIKYIFLERNLYEMVSSALRRNFTQSSYEQYKISRWNRAYIESFLNRRSGPVLKLRYNQLFDDIEMVEKLIREYIEEDLVLDTSNLRPPIPKNTGLLEVENFIKKTER